jgi:hypothetical protein
MGLGQENKPKMPGRSANLSPAVYRSRGESSTQRI